MWEPRPLATLWASMACIFYYYYPVCEAVGTAATPGLLCQPRVIVKMIVEKQMECRLAGETEVLGKNQPQRSFGPSQNPTWPDPGLNPGRRGGKPELWRGPSMACNRDIFTFTSYLLMCLLSLSGVVVILKCLRKCLYAELIKEAKLWWILLRNL
jgi:hypothetical protein